jgi:hypothetical protein
MRKGLLAISLVLLLSLAIVFPSCTGEGETTGTIEVKATLDGAPWTGAVDYTLTPASGSPVNGSSVDDSFTEDAGTLTCAYVSGGPGAFVDITTAETQNLIADGTITFTLNFQTVQVDVSVVFDTWSINGTPVPPTPAGPGTFWWISPDTVVDAHYTVQVGGGGNNTGKPVTVHETKTISVHNVGIEGEIPGGPIKWHVLNGFGAIQTDPPFDVSNQKATKEGQPVAVCTIIDLPYCEPISLDAECDIETEVGATFTKKVNWVRNPVGVNITPLALWDDSIFEISESPAFCVFTLVTTACEALGEEGFVDTDPSNDCSAASPMLYIGILPPGFPATPLPPG